MARPTGRFKDARQLVYFSRHRPSRTLCRPSRTLGALPGVGFYESWLFPISDHVAQRNVNKVNNQKYLTVAEKKQVQHRRRETSLKGLTGRGSGFPFHFSQLWVSGTLVLRKVGGDSLFASQPAPIFETPPFFIVDREDTGQKRVFPVTLVKVSRTPFTGQTTATEESERRPISISIFFSFCLEVPSRVSDVFILPFFPVFVAGFGRLSPKGRSPEMSGSLQCVHSSSRSVA